MKVLDRIALALVIIGALNWGAVGLFRFDCVAAIFGGQAAPISRVVYALVGLAGLPRREDNEKTAERRSFSEFSTHFILFIFFSARLRSLFLRWDS